MRVPPHPRPFRLCVPASLGSGGSSSRPAPRAVTSRRGLLRCGGRSPPPPRRSGPGPACVPRPPLRGARASHAKPISSRARGSPALPDPRAPRAPLLCAGIMNGSRRGARARGGRGQGGASAAAWAGGIRPDRPAHRATWGSCTRLPLAASADVWALGELPLAAAAGGAGVNEGEAPPAGRCYIVTSLPPRCSHGSASGGRFGGSGPREGGARRPPRPSPRPRASPRPQIPRTESTERRRGERKEAAGRSRQRRFHHPPFPRQPPERGENGRFSIFFLFFIYIYFFYFLRLSCGGHGRCSPAWGPPS
ncbi:translation initiation factor IF-2-like [Pyrgilauda ruficollis]|uniref:translation initiation factor IF-2-like n=1 Tax=Pyrgilauda ruficollis TaxID=221976 RepID=UPI001B87351B|nr:translation initiation factor IF-2-like [Pyrgilauda ruficollis]